MASVLDGYTPTEWLILEVLAGRYRLGEHIWPFPNEVFPAVKSLTHKKLVSWKWGVIEGTVNVSFTETGIKKALSEYYKPASTTT